MVVGVHWSFASERRTRNLRAAVRDHFVYVHVELRATSRHPDVQREHVVVLACQNLVTDLQNQIVTFLVETFTGEIGIRCSLLQSRVSGNHLSGNQILSYVEMFE